MNPNEKKQKKTFKDAMKQIELFLSNPIKVFKLFLSIAIFLLILVGGFFGYSFVKNQELNSKTDELKTFSPEMVAGFGFDPNSINCDFSNMDKMVECYEKQSKEKDSMFESFQKLQVPYSYFLINLYLPSMNIWYDPYMDNYDMGIIGDRFMDENPFLDVKLMQKWSDFFKKVSDSLPNNDIKNIKISDIEEVQNPDLSGYNRVGINVEFTATQNNSFLMLVDKLSISSNKRNISLIDEFTYNLWNTVKADKTRKDILEKLTRSRLASIEANKGKKIDKNSIDITEDDLDKTLGQQFYKWTTDSCEDIIDPMEKNICLKNIQDADYNKIFVDSVISKTMKKSANCDNPDDVSISSTCYYNFREKFKDIPLLAYTLGDQSMSNSKISNLKKFYSQIPPLLNITKFSFTKDQDADSGELPTYRGEIEFDIYGRGVSNDDLKNIQTLLGKNCIGTETPLTVDGAIQIVTSKVDSLSKTNNSADQNSRFRDYSDLITLLNKTQLDMSTATQYEKVIKTFEIYRMLKENNVCKQIGTKK